MNFIASAIRPKACKLCYKFFYTNTNKLMVQHKIFEADDSSLIEIKRLQI
jgi:hypothetical protein